MKKLVFISGPIGFSISFLGIMFKMMHWPGAGIMLVLGLATLALVFVPFLFAYLYRVSR